MDPRDRRDRLEEAGKWLRQQRRRKYSTAAAFARVLEVDSSQISNYERGMHEVPAERIPVIASALGVEEIQVWRGLQRPMPASTQDPRDTITRELRELRAVIASQLSGNKRADAIAQMDEIERQFANVQRLIGEAGSA